MPAQPKRGEREKIKGKEIIRKIKEITKTQRKGGSSTLYVIKMERLDTVWHSGGLV